jgi:hypothetical protein
MLSVFGGGGTWRRGSLLSQMPRPQPQKSVGNFLLPKDTYHRSMTFPSAFEVIQIAVGGVVVVECFLQS